MAHAVTVAEVLTVTPDLALTTDAGPELVGFLEAQGLAVRGRRLVLAEDAETERALRQAVEAGGLVVCLGEGEGAEIIRQVLARLTGSRLVLSDRLLEALATAHARRDEAMPRRAERLALIPQGATVLMAADGGEPGFRVETAGTPVAVLPNDARLAIALAREHLLPGVIRGGAEPVSVARTLRLVGLDASEVEARLVTALRGEDAARGHPVVVGGEVRLRLTLRGPTAAAAAERFRRLEPALRAELGVAWYGSDDETLEVVVGRLLSARGLTVALAESCTGGLVGHRLTQVAGSSAYFERGVVVYSNAAKQALLDVPDSVLREHGAVSAECAEAMARGVRLHAGTDLGVSVTGIAGPEGGTPVKPVGTVFIGLADPQRAVTQRFRFREDREGNKAWSALMALDLIRRYCLGAV